MPSSADTICEYAVAWPWPCADVPALSVALPSWCTSTSEYSPPAAAGDLDVERDADAELLDVAALAARRLLGEQLVVAGDARAPR